MKFLISSLKILNNILIKQLFIIIPMEIKSFATDRC